MTTVRFDLDPDESARLGARVASLVLDEGQAVPEAAVVAAEARRSGIQLVTWTTPGPVAAPGFLHAGTLRAYEAPLATVLERLPRAVRFGTRAIREADWPAVEGLLAHAAPTRFSRDDRFDRSRLRARKLAVLRRFVTERDGAGAVATARTLEGFQLTYRRDTTAVLYELAVAPSRTRPLMAAELVAFNLRGLASRFAIDRVETLIYDDNRPSRAFFTGFGLEPSARRSCYYHLWT